MASVLKMHLFYANVFCMHYRMLLFSLYCSITCTASNYIVVAEVTCVFLCEGCYIACQQEQLLQNYVMNIER